jgi:hypothetical protein
MKKAFPIMLMVLGAVFLVAGVYTIYRGVDARDQVRQELVAQNITTPDDASIPNARVEDIATARSMAEIIDKHALDSTEGRTYAEMGRYLAVNGGDTNDAEEAVTGADGRPVANPMRNVAFQASTLRTSLFSSIMAFEVATLVTGLGLMISALGIAVGGTGVAFAGLVLPSVARRVHVDPVAAD